MTKVWQVIRSVEETLLTLGHNPAARVVVKMALAAEADIEARMPPQDIARDLIRKYLAGEFGPAPQS